MNVSQVSLYDIKKVASVVLITIGCSGLWYSLPYILKGFTTNVPTAPYFFVFAITTLLFGLIIPRIQLSKQTKYNLLIPNQLMWRKVFGLLLISTTLFLSLFIYPNPVTGYAPYTFAYNLGFFIPVVHLSFGISLAGLILGVIYILYKEYKLLYKVIPMVSLLLVNFVLAVLLFMIYR